MEPPSLCLHCGNHLYSEAYKWVHDECVEPFQQYLDKYVDDLTPRQRAYKEKVQLERLLGDTKVDF